MSLTPKVQKILKKQFKEAVREGESVMKAFAPQPRPVEKGLGSYSTGQTRQGIHTENHGEYEAWVGVVNDHTKWAENGRPGFTNRKLMRWKDKRGRWHSAYKVGAMEGWHFVEKTANYMKNKYGG